MYVELSYDIYITLGCKNAFLPPPQEWVFKSLQYLKLKRKRHTEGDRTRAWDKKSCKFSVVKYLCFPHILAYDPMQTLCVTTLHYE